MFLLSYIIVSFLFLSYKIISFCKKGEETTKLQNMSIIDGFLYFVVSLSNIKDTAVLTNIFKRFFIQK